MVAALQSIAGQQPGSQHRLAESLQRKLDHIEQNGRRSHPDPTPTVMTENEINDYFAAGRVQLPQGVKNVRFHGQSGLLTGIATIDFDEIRAAQNLPIHCSPSLVVLTTCSWKLMPQLPAE